MKPKHDSLLMDSYAENRENMRQLADQFRDLILEYWQTTDQDPVLPQLQPEDFNKLHSPHFPEEGIPVPDILDECRRLIFPGLTRVASPRYLGMMNPSPALVAVFAEGLSAAFNQNCSLWHQSPAGVEVEKTVIDWLLDLAGLDPSTGGGSIVSGGSIANITALKLARARAVGRVVSTEGMYSHPPLCVYASDQAHYSFEKAMDFLGMGTRYLRYVPSDDTFRIRLDNLTRIIRADREQGLVPACVVGIAGTTNTGSIDPLAEMAEIARREQVWFHIDAAYGGAALLVESARELFSGIESADSITMDPHKWFFIPYEGAALLVKDRSLLRSAFSVQPAYYLEQGEPHPGKINYFEYGLQGSRSFKALKMWATFKYYGRQHYEQIISRNIRFSSELSSKFSRSDGFEPMHHPDLGILCFRANPNRGGNEAALSREDLNQLNRRIHNRIEHEGRFWLSITRLKENQLALRVNFQNYRTSREHLNELFSYLEHLLQEEVNT